MVSFEGWIRQELTFGSSNLGRECFCKSIFFWDICFYIKIISSPWNLSLSQHRNENVYVGIRKLVSRASVIFSSVLRHATGETREKQITCKGRIAQGEKRVRRETWERKSAVKNYGGLSFFLLPSRLSRPEGSFYACHLIIWCKLTFV